jgi:hypothetical protein
MSWDAAVEGAHPRGGVSARVDLHLGAHPGELPVASPPRARRRAAARAPFRVWAGLRLDRRRTASWLVRTCGGAWSAIDRCSSRRAGPTEGAQLCSLQAP